jgi:hypothetical protein
MCMRTPTKARKTFSLDATILAEIRRTEGAISKTERVNHLLRFALDAEKRAALYQEAGSFYSSEPDDRKERRAWQAAIRNSP